MHACIHTYIHTSMHTYKQLVHILPYNNVPCPHKNNAKTLHTHTCTYISTYPGPAARIGAHSSGWNGPSVAEPFTQGFTLSNSPSLLMSVTLTVQRLVMQCVSARLLDVWTISCLICICMYVCVYTYMCLCICVCMQVIE